MTAKELKAINEVSIIINGVRYDAVEATKKQLNDFCFIACHSCDLDKKCNKHDAYDLCRNVLGSFKYFKKIR